MLAVVAFGGGADVVVYNGRSQYGDEAVFKAFEEATGKKLELRGGTAPELFERLRSEGSETPADLLVTTDLANLWRAKEAGLLEPVSTADARAAGAGALPRSGRGLVRAEPARPHADALDERARGRRARATRTSATRAGRASSACARRNNEYNQSLVADMLAKRGPEKTRALLESWMANEPRILGSDVDVLDAIASGRCDVGLTNHYYLARELEEDPDFPVAPGVARPGRRRRAHQPLRRRAGQGLRAPRRRDRADGAPDRAGGAARDRRQRRARRQARRRRREPVPGAFGAKLDPIDVERAGRLLPDAVALMQEVGWK